MATDEKGNNIYGWIDFRDFDDYDTFFKKVKDDVGTENISDNYDPLRPGDLEPGDLVLQEGEGGEMDHTMVVIDNDGKKKKVTIGEGHYHKDPKKRRPVNTREIAHDEVKRYRRKKDNHFGGREWKWKRIGGGKKPRPATHPSP